MVANQLEDILEVEEEEEPCVTAAGPNNHTDSSNPQPPEPPKPQKKNRCWVRQGKRQHFERLAHWRGEKIVYGRSVTPDGHQKVLGVVDVFRVPTIAKPPQSFRATKQNQHRITKIKSQGVAAQEIHDNRQPEEGWDLKTLPNGTLYSFSKQKDIECAIVCTKEMVTLEIKGKAGIPNLFESQEVFKHLDFFAGRYMHIPVGGNKQREQSKNNCYVN
ncbi:uncharacterized protein PGTG_09829 [Puccinia graminis f. sp. tritici CRL 75-36-700-3]|uniref:Uncharacterized protein n=1 Tax=Puccinia graminis f. sp. tritici (strain CRL 75-36-700-3 / race SCCL) TaxID=418459 RepID=E3KF30_PUCGT|nr:uncharacterized protein PGTG_09829 [Puccinia graminis f. sp. tritici CRL 75-36-700-3]EFP82861.1 hypothetical protein PGTG_09829 [Puccinia graminis f. sp. tritici CRL 75-36-700-3]